MKDRDQQLLTFIEQCIKSNGYPPSYTEMMKGIGEKSKNGIARKLKRLEESGHISRVAGVSRALVVNSSN